MEFVIVLKNEYAVVYRSSFYDAIIYAEDKYGEDNIVSITRVLNEGE